jgi:predicted phage-related endonuclease
LFGNTDFRIYEIKRDLELEEMILERARSFWEDHVLKDAPPKPQSESDLRSLFPKTETGKAVVATSETIELIKKLQSIQTQIESHEQEVSALKQGIMSQMQDAELLILDGKTIATWKTPKPSLRVDTKRLTEDHPDIIAQYQVESASSRRLVIKGVE